MEDCCSHKETELVQLRTTQGRTLRIVLVINAAMFVIEMGSGIVSRSTSLMADSLDMLGDAIVYGFSLYVLHRGAHARAKAALLKGGIMCVFGLGVLAQAIQRAWTGTAPNGEIMGVVGTAALAANLTCLGLLFRHRSDDLNMRSTWICSRNDILANVGVLVAAFLVTKFGTNVPDLVVGSLIALLFLGSAFGVLRESLRELRA